MGTDWPAVAETSDRIAQVLAESGLDAREQQMIAGGNTLNLIDRNDTLAKTL
jgi:hypothetical protein